MRAMELRHDDHEGRMRTSITVQACGGRKDDVNRRWDIDSFNANACDRLLLCER